MTNKRIGDKRSAINEVWLSLRNRGPDEFTHLSHADFYFFHSRLAVVDAKSKSIQPLTHGDYIGLLNGELYNYDALRREMEARGYFFTSNNDSELLLYLYESLGEDMFERLEGEYSFVIYNKKTEDIIAAVDPFGIKPLYYLQEGDLISIGSRKSTVLLTVPAKKRRIDHKAASHAATYGYLPTGKTLIEGLCKLGPGEILTIKDGRRKKRRYYDLMSLLNERSIAELEEKAESELNAESKDIGIDETYSLDRIKNLLMDAVRRRIPSSDQHMAVHLSGGLDSSIVSGILALMAPSDATN